MREVLLTVHGCHKEKEGEWEGIGHCAVGYIDGEIPQAAERRDGRVFWAE